LKLSFSERMLEYILSSLVFQHKLSAICIASITLVVGRFYTQSLSLWISLSHPLLTTGGAMPCPLHKDNIPDGLGYEMGVKMAGIMLWPWAPPQRIRGNV
jgi:hypothetical protein